MKLRIKFLFICSAILTISGCVVNQPGTQLSSSDSKVRRENLSEHQALAALGMDELLAGNAKAASYNFNKALKLNPRVSNYHMLNAISYHMEAVNGNSDVYDLAKQGYDLAIKFDSSNWLASYMAGRLHLELLEYKQAQQKFAQALLLVDDEPAILMGLAYASYHAGDAEIAASMIDRLKSMDALKTAQDFQNAALMYAAVGKDQEANEYFQRLQKIDDNRWRSSTIKRRLEDWHHLHENVSSKIQPSNKSYWKLSHTLSNTNKASLSLATLSTSSSSAAEAESATPEVAESVPVNIDGKMAVVDVVIIRSEETIGSSKGVNLLNGLKIQFGPTGGSAYSDTHNGVFTGPATSPGGNTYNYTDTITRAVSIPALTYSLNIFNSNSQRNEILARPTIVAVEGKRSDFFSGVELNAAAVAGGINGGESVLIQKDIGVKLSVTPSFRDDGKLNLAVQAERTFLKTPNADVNFTFRIETSKTTVNANVVMRFGETLILSGLSEKESEATRDGVPVLQDIPLVQYGFSQSKTKEFQKSVLILLTPRPAQYVYQPEKARLEYEQSLSEDERPMANLKARYSDWFKPYPNWASVFHHMQKNSLYRGFRTGDVELENWNSSETLSERLKQALNFLWY